MTERQIIHRLIRLLEEAEGDVGSELQAAGADEVEQNPILKGKRDDQARRRRALARIKEALASQRWLAHIGVPA